MPTNDMFWAEVLRYVEVSNSIFGVIMVFSFLSSFFW